MLHLDSHPINKLLIHLFCSQSWGLSLNLLTLGTQHYTLQKAIYWMTTFEMRKIKQLSRYHGNGQITPTTNTEQIIINTVITGRPSSLKFISESGLPVRTTRKCFNVWWANVLQWQELPCLLMEKNPHFFDPWYQTIQHCFNEFSSMDDALNLINANHLIHCLTVILSF